MLEETQRRNALLDDYCTEIGRALQTLRRSLLVFGQEAMTIFNSVDAFKDVVFRVIYARRRRRAMQTDLSEGCR